MPEAKGRRPKHRTFRELIMSSPASARASQSYTTQSRLRPPWEIVRPTTGFFGKEGPLESYAGQQVSTYKLKKNRPRQVETNLEHKGGMYPSEKVPESLGAGIEELHMSNVPREEMPLTVPEYQNLLEMLSYLSQGGKL